MKEKRAVLIALLIILLSFLSFYYSDSLTGGSVRKPSEKIDIGPTEPAIQQLEGLQSQTIRLPNNNYITIYFQKTRPLQDKEQDEQEETFLRLISGK